MTVQDFEVSSIESATSSSLQRLIEEYQPLSPSYRQMSFPLSPSTSSLLWKRIFLSAAAALLLLPTTEARIGSTEKESANLANAPVEAVPSINLTPEQDAARFLAQTTFGPTLASIESLASALKENPKQAYRQWILAEFKKPIAEGELALPLFRAAYPKEKATDGAFTSYYRKNAESAGAIRASLMIDSDHQLRRRVAYALSQIFVVSVDGSLRLAPEGMCDWDDMLFQNAFGRFDEILRKVTLHPTMGSYLTSAGNAKAGFFNATSRPDENYAREIMQLFTIGLYQLKPNGEYQVDASGKLIPTYDNAVVQEYARAFTGMVYPRGPITQLVRDKKTGESHVKFLPKGQVRYGSMAFVQNRHDADEKTLLNGVSLPAGQTASEDISGAIESLVTHPNTAPFISRLLIQRLVASNPSREYVEAVSKVFTQSRGEMKEVLLAILLHPEARTPSADPKAGRLQEPWIRLTQFLRAFNPRPAKKQPLYPLYRRTLYPALGQYPLAAPSVFNFYLPTYQPPGAITQLNTEEPITSYPFTAPEFQILNAVTAFKTPNTFFNILSRQREKGPKRLPPIDIRPQIALANDTTALIDHINLLLTHGMMSPATRAIIEGAVNAIPPIDPASHRARAEMAIYLTAISPDCAVQK